MATRDGRQILISIQSDREWAKFHAEFLVRRELLRCARDVERMRNHAETDAIVGAAFAGLYEAEVRQALLRVDFAFSAVNDKTALAAQSAEESKKLFSISLDFAHRSALSGRGKTAHASTNIT